MNAHYSGNVRHATSPRNILSALGVAFIAMLSFRGYNWLFPPVPKYLSQVPDDNLISPLGLICHAHETLAQHQLTRSDTAVTLFSVLHLDYKKPPFYPADDCALPFHPNYRQARQAISNAWGDMTVNHDGNMMEWRDLFAAAAHALLNDSSRAIYMKEVLPQIEIHQDKAWKKICDKGKQ